MSAEIVVRPVPIRDAFRTVADARQFIGSVIAILAGFGVLTTVQGDALTGLVGAIPGLISLTGDVIHSFQVRDAIAESEAAVTPLDSPAVFVGRDLVAAELVPLTRN